MSLRDESRPPSFIEAAALATLERAVNSALRSDPVTAQALNAHSGRLISLQLTLPPIQVFILIVEDGIEFYHQSDAQADVDLKGSAVDLIAQLLEWRGAPSVIGGPVTVRGDRELLQDIIAIAQKIDIDWGALAEPILGSELAQQIDYGTRRLFGWARDAASRLGGQLSEYLREESSLLALRREVFEFNQDVDELRADTDRLAARIALLKRQSGKTL
jgi:ubiquinone biosynthesis protein UbiJ